MRLSDVQFQPVAQNWLQRTLRAGRTPHACLFAGPDGVGKEMLAARAAAVLLCERPAEEVTPENTRARRADSAPEAAPGGARRGPCGKCIDCTLMAAGNHPDFHRINRALSRFHPEKRVRNSKATELGIDVIRHFLLGEIGRRPARGRAKVFVVTEAEKLNIEAQNALLKTLEEPPGHSYLFLVTPTPELLLPTIRSRCQTVAFVALPRRFVEQQLQSRGVEGRAAAYLAELTQGRLGEALRLAELGLAGQAPTVIELVERAKDDPLAAGAGLKGLADDLARAARKAAPEESAPDADDELELAEDEDIDAADKKTRRAPDTNFVRQAQHTVLAMAAFALRDVLRLCAGSSAAAHDGSAVIARLARGATVEGMAGAIRAAADAEWQIRASVNASLVFDAVGLAMQRGLRGEPVAAI